MPIFIGYDPREALAYHVCVQSIIEHASRPVMIVPLALSCLPGYVERHTDGTNQFIYSRFLVPWLMRWRGFALFLDGDMVLQDDVWKLYALRDPAKAVQVVQHPPYQASPRKYIGTAMEAKNEWYPRKNWSSVILWHCAHPENWVLKPRFVETQSGSYLHRFGWLEDELIGALPPEWNHLEGETAPKKASLVHYTLGVPGIAAYAKSENAPAWHRALENLLRLPT